MWNKQVQGPQDLSENLGRGPIQVLFHPDLFVCLYSDAVVEINVCSHSTPIREADALLFVWLSQ